MNVVEILASKVRDLESRLRALEARETPERTWRGSKNVGDSVATGIMTVSPVATAEGVMDTLILLRLVLRSSASRGYANVEEVWIVGMGYYHDGAASSGRGGATLLGRIDTGSANAGFSDVGSGTVTVAYAGDVFTIRVQADHTGSLVGGTVICEWRAEALSNNIGKLTITPVA